MSRFVGCCHSIPIFCSCFAQFQCLGPGKEQTATRPCGSQSAFPHKTKWEKTKTVTKWKKTRWKRSQGRGE
eukprot:2518426-Amphidinium_carterae.1